MNKVIICGSCKTGKSTYAAALSQKTGIKVISTDDYISTHSWADAPEAIIKDIKNLDSYILEGVNAGRCIRSAHKLGINLGYDTVYYLSDEHIPLTKPQMAQKKGCETIWKDVVKILDNAKLEVIYGLPLDFDN